MTAHATPAVHLYLHQPTALFKARVNMPGTITYPITEIPFDGVTLGAYTAVSEDQTLLLGSTEGADDYGRTRVKGTATATTIRVGRASQGTEDGTLTVVDNAFITVLEDFRVWAKLPYQDPNGVDYKDASEPVGTFMTAIPPVVNFGAGFANYTSGGIITVSFDAANSYVMADGATISTYAWDVGDGTITVGTVSSSAITATFPAGFRWVALTIVDSNGRAHTSRRPVLAVNPAADTTITTAQVEGQRLTQNGQTLRVRFPANIPRTTYPDGTLAMLWWDAPSSPSDRSHMKFIGWLQSEDASLRPQRQGLVRETTLEFVDVAGRLDTLPGFPQALQREAEDDVDIQWSLMPNLDINKALHYLIYWHSTALGVADFILPVDGDDYPSMRLDSTGATLYDQVNSRALSMTPDHVLCCNSQGALSVLEDWFYVDVGDRPTVAHILTEDDYSDISFAYQRPPRVHVLRSSAVVTSTDWIMLGGEKTLPLAFAIAPGAAFSQGTSEQTEAEGLCRSQSQLNITTGHKYARLNARFGPVRVTLLDPDDIWEFEPALMQRLQLNIAATYAAQRGLPFTSTQAMCKELSITYRSGKQGPTIEAQATLELETSGPSAVTHIPEETEPVDDYEATPLPSFTPPLPGDEEYFYGDMGPFVVWDGAHVLRTWEIQDSPPVWELVDTGITGNIYDGQYVHVSATRVGMWLMTSTAIWWCDNIKAAGPVWTAVLPIATVQAAEATPAVGTSIFKTMFNYATEPGYLCVATGPNAGASSNENYAHAYFWHTHNYGLDWTMVDMTNHLRNFGGGAFIHGYMHAGLYAMNIYRSGEPSGPGTIWCIRGSVNIGGDIQVRVFYSTDLGTTWQMGATPVGNGGNVNTGATSLLNPFPDIDDVSYAVTGLVTPATSTLQSSIDAWVSKSNLTAPTGYSGVSPLWRVNKRTFDNLHIIAWWLHTASNEYHLLETVDGGTNWTLLYDSNLTEIAIPNTPSGNQTAARHNRASGWPVGTEQQWVLIRAGASGVTTGLVQLTTDNFATAPVDKTGNIITLVGAWSSGCCDGFALPK